MQGRLQGKQIFPFGKRDHHTRVKPLPVVGEQGVQKCFRHTAEIRNFPRGAASGKAGVHQPGSAHQPVENALPHAPLQPAVGEDIPCGMHSVRQLLAKDHGALRLGVHLGADGNGVITAKPADAG